MKTTYDNTHTSTDAELGKDEAVCEAVPAYKLPDKWEPPFEEGKRYTYSDYLTWPDAETGGPLVHYELIEGIPFVMWSPSRRHQKISGELFRQVANYLKGKPCEVYAEPFDVRFDENGADDIVVKPDISVICDHSKLTDAGCSGAPDFIIEILSPSTAQKDKLIKLRLYEKHGVREYWIVEPDTKLVTVYTLGDDGRYKFDVYDNANKIPVSVLPGCAIDLTEVFAE